MKRDRMDEILRSAAADAESDISDYMAELDSGGEKVSAELDRCVTAMFRSHRRMKRMRALTSAAAAIVAAVCVWISVSGVLPEKYLIGEVAEPTWFPGEVKKTVITNTEYLFEAVYTTEDGREFYFSQEKYSIAQDEGSRPLFDDESLSYFESESLEALDGVIYSEQDAADSSSDSWLEWSNGGCKFVISGDANEIELRRMIKSTLE